MFRFILLGALALASVAFAVKPQTIKADWTVPRTQFLGFNERGDLVTRGRNTAGLNVLDTATGQAKRMVVFPEIADWREVSDLVFTPDLKTIAWSNRQGNSVTLRTPDGLWQTPPANGVQLVKGLALSQDGGTLAVVTFNSYIQLWDTKTHTRRHTLMLMSDPLAFNPDGKTLVATNIFGTGGVTLWDVLTGEKRLALPQVETPPRPLQFLPDDLLFAGNHLIHLNAPDSSSSISSFERYIEACPAGGYWKSCRRDVQSGSASQDGELIALNIRRTPQNVASALLYDTNGKLLKILDAPADSNFPRLTPDAKRLIWQSNRGDLMGAKVP